MTLPFDGAISRYFREGAPKEVRKAIEKAGKDGYQIMLKCVNCGKQFRMKRATAAISVEFVVTVVAVLVGAFVLDEPLTALQLCGGAVIVLGCALVLGILRLPRPAA